MLSRLRFVFAAKRGTIGSAFWSAERLGRAAARAILQLLQFSRKVFGGHARQTRCSTLIKDAHFRNIGADALENVLSSLLSACPAGIFLVKHSNTGNPFSVRAVLRRGEPDMILVPQEEVFHEEGSHSRDDGG